MNLPVQSNILGDIADSSRHHMEGSSEIPFLADKFPFTRFLYSDDNNGGFLTEGGTEQAALYPNHWSDRPATSSREMV